MEDDNEVLDWGHEEEDGTTAHGGEQRTFSVDDAEDAVSLGGDEEDEFLTYQSRVPQDSPHCAHSPPRSARLAREDPSKGHGGSPHIQDQNNEWEQPSLPSRAQTLGTLVHALPPKPVASTVPFVHPSHPSIIEATAMASRADRDKRNGTSSKASPYDHNDPLPPGWEVKHPRNGRGVYYYNVHTHESTWTRPTTPATREKRSERSDRRDDLLDKPLSARNENPMPRVGRAESGDMSYNDRHYRPGEAARREERPAPSTQLIDSYIPDSYSPNHRNNRPSPPSSRARERDSTPPPRRPPSPIGSFEDRDVVQSSHREAPSASLSTQDRIWVARDSVSRERPRERRQDDPTPPESERRNLPRDTERSSTLRPKSPVSYTRRSQESASTITQPSNRPTQSLPEAPAGRKNRFSQIDSLVQHGHRQIETRDPGMRRVRTDDFASHNARYGDDTPSSRSMTDVRVDDDISTYPTSDAQRQGSRKRIALPPQDEVRPGARQTPQRGSSYAAGPPGIAPVSVPPSRHSARIIPDDMSRDSVRRSSSPSSPQSGPFPADRDDRDRARSWWPKPHANDPSQLDAHTIHESSRGRGHDVAMDVDDPPLPRSSDLPVKQVPARRSALQDEAPRYPRAMLNSDNDCAPRGIREARDGIDSRHRFTTDDAPRYSSSRDRQGMERHFTDQVNSQNEPVRGNETKPPVGSNIKLSGTNNIPIGARNKFPSNVLSAPVPLNSTRWGPAVTSGGNGEPVGSRRDRVIKDHERPPHLDGASGDRNVPLPSIEPTRHDNFRVSVANKSRVLLQTEPALVPAARLSRAAMGTSRFGPPVVKEDTEVIRPQKSVSSESLHSEKIPEGSTHATPPPPSESSMTSFKDLAPSAPARPSHLPPRPASPPRGYQCRSGEVNKLYHHPNDARANEMNAEVTSPRLSPPLRKDTVFNIVPAIRDDRGMRSPERSRINFRDSDVNHHVARPPVPSVQDEDRDRAPPPMHPERALMLQANGLPPRPPSALGRARSVKGQRRERRDDHDQDRAEPLRGNKRGHYRSASPMNERRRYPEDDRMEYTGGGRGGASLLDRLSLDDGNRVNSPSLRERVQLPSKRDREEMLGVDTSFDIEGEDYETSKRMRRRGGPKMRKGRF